MCLIELYMGNMLYDSFIRFVGEWSITCYLVACLSLSSRQQKLHCKPCATSSRMTVKMLATVECNKADYFGVDRCARWSQERNRANCCELDIFLSLKSYSRNASWELQTRSHVIIKICNVNYLYSVFLVTACYISAN